MQLSPNLRQLISFILISPHPQYPLLLIIGLSYSVFVRVFVDGLEVFRQQRPLVVELFVSNVDLVKSSISNIGRLLWLLIKLDFYPELAKRISRIYFLLFLSSRLDEFPLRCVYLLNLKLLLAKWVIEKLFISHRLLGFIIFFHFDFELLLLGQHLMEAADNLLSLNVRLRLGVEALHQRLSLELVDFQDEGDLLDELCFSIWVSASFVDCVRHPDKRVDEHKPRENLHEIVPTYLFDLSMALMENAGHFEEVHAFVLTENNSLFD